MVEAFKIKVGISSCLLGKKVRWDGTHRQDRSITGFLGRYFDWVPVCPEFEIGMGVPRETVHLVKEGNNTRMLGTLSRKDWTSSMRKFSRDKTAGLAAVSLSGFIFKKGSPSCGTGDVAVYAKAGTFSGLTASGLFAGAFMARFPLVPVEEEGRLKEAAVRKSFIARVFSFYLLRGLLAKFSKKALRSFHEAHKGLLLSHSVKHYRELERLAADAGKLSTAELKERYSVLFMETLRIKTTLHKNEKVLRHRLKYLNKELEEREKKDVFHAIEDYRKELVPLIVPVTLISRFTATPAAGESH